MRLARSTSLTSARGISRVSVGCAIALGCTVVSTTTRKRSFVARAPVLCATDTLSWISATNCSSPRRWRHRASEERSKGSLWQKVCSPQKNWKYGFSIHRAHSTSSDRPCMCLPGDQPRRQPGLARSGRVHRAEALVEKTPIDLRRQPHQRVTHVDNLIEGRLEQVLLAIIPRSCHAFPNADAALRESRTRKIETANCRKLAALPRLSCESDYFDPSRSDTQLNNLLVLHGRLFTESAFCKKCYRDVEEIRGVTLSHQRRFGSRAGATRLRHRLVHRL